MQTTTQHIEMIRNTRATAARRIVEMRREFPQLDRPLLNRLCRDVLKLDEIDHRPTIAGLRGKALRIITGSQAALNHPDAYGCPNVCGADDGWFEQHYEWLAFGWELLAEVVAWARKDMR